MLLNAVVPFVKASVCILAYAIGIRPNQQLVTATDFGQVFGPEHLPNFK
jgi:hypothetical protein